MGNQPFVNEIIDFGSVAFGYGLRDLAIGSRLWEMVVEGMFHVDIIFEDSWSKIFITLDNEKLFLKLEIMKGEMLMAEEVGKHFTFGEEAYSVGS